VEGATVLAIHDEDHVRRDTLIEKLSSLKLGQVVAGSSDPTGYEFVVNATPIGMKETDPCPIQTDLLSKQAFVGDVITMPAITPLIHNARAAGCQTVTGTEMFAGVKDLMIEFLVGK
jgi:shikimate dehydrogenase